MSAPAVETRVLASRGASASAVYRMAADAIATRHSRGGTLVDVGCGGGAFGEWTRGRFDRYVGVDAVRWEGFPAHGGMVLADLDGGVPLPDGCGDVVAALETIEHLENPRAFARELVRLARPGGWVVVTTPNQLSLLSKATLLLHDEFNAFRAGSYPAHLTALLEVDLRRIAGECGLTDVAVAFSGRGRMPLGGRHWPAALSRAFPRAFSDNVLLAGRKPLA